jgi:hypothetical protein
VPVRLLASRRDLNGLSLTADALLTTFRSMEMMLEKSVAYK